MVYTNIPMDPYPKIPTRTIMVMIGKVNRDLLPALFTLVTHYQEHPMEKYYNIIAFSNSGTEDSSLESAIANNLAT